MKIKTWLKYFIYMILIYFLIFIRDYIGNLFSESYYRYEKPAMFFYAVINLLLGVGIGMFFGLEHFIRELRKEGIWQINFPKLILLGLPSLCFSLINICLIIGSQFVYKIIAFIPLDYLFRYGSVHVAIIQMLLGYMVITSFFKSSEKT